MVKHEDKEERGTCIGEKVKIEDRKVLRLKEETLVEHIPVDPEV
jgi:hypothetical protein